MAVRHDGDERTIGRPRQNLHGLAFAHAADVPGNMRRKSAGARIDPGHRERKRRKRQHQGAADVTGTKQIERRQILAKPFDDAAVAQLRVGGVA